MSMWTEIKTFVYTTAGHAFTGAVTGAIYEVTQLIANSGYDAKTILFAALIGGSLGFFKAIVDAIESVKTPSTAIRTKKFARSYFGI